MNNINMTPTNRLRFVIREEKHWLDDRTYNVRRTRVLQQWWEDQSTGVYWVNGNPGEWRDIALEDEA